jgi:hypothetical protein
MSDDAITSTDPDPQPTIDDLVAQARTLDSEGRSWLRAITPLLALRSHDTDPSGRVQLAFDLLHVAACERAARILRADLAEDPG